MNDREQAWGLLTEFTQSESLRKHALAVEACMRAYARKFHPGSAPEEELWGVVGLLHDFDYEQNPTLDTHVHVGCRILRQRGCPEELVEAIASHADYMGIARDTPLKKALFASDELVGFIGACVKVRPSRALADLPVESIIKKLKDKAFARSVDRQAVYDGALAVGRPLPEHVGFVIEALKPIAGELGL
jgi:putative nucleotidyltransferase with HDIG domain